MTTLISFYTKDWQYPQHAKRLAAECKALDMPCVIEELPSTGSYLKNTCLKPQFILDKLRELKSPVLWVDVDGSLLKSPDLFDGWFVDMNADGLIPVCQEYYYNAQRDFAARRMPQERNRTWHVGTMWFNYTPNMIKLLEQWIANTGNLSDESALEKTWQQLAATINTVDLPPEYFYIGKKPPAGTVIMHRISNGDSKRREMPLGAQKRQRGEW